MPRKRFDYLMMGNSAAAISAVEAIRSVDARGTIGVVSPEDVPAYSTPMISYLLKGAVSEEAMSIRPEGFYREHGVELILGKAVTSIDADAHAVVVGSGRGRREIGYGKLLVACGSAPAPAPVEGLAGDNVFPFLNLTDARAILARLDRLKSDGREGLRAVVIGSGLIGCKACEGLAGTCGSVTMLARSPEILRSVLDAKASPIAEAALARGGVDVRLSAQAAGFRKEGGAVVSLDLDDGSAIDCDLVVLAAGSVPNVSVAQAAGAACERGLVCDAHMRTTLADVFAAGDVARTRDDLSGRDRAIALWPNAVAEGRVAGLCMAGADAELSGEHPMNSITLFGTTVVSAGLKGASEGQREIVFEGDGEFAKFVVGDGCLLGFALVNRPESAGVYTRMIDERIPIDSVSPSIFERAPQMSDLPRELAQSALHEGMLQAGEGADDAGAAGADDAGVGLVPTRDNGGLTAYVPFDAGAGLVPTRDNGGLTACVPFEQVERLRAEGLVRAHPSRNAAKSRSRARTQRIELGMRPFNEVNAEIRDLIAAGASRFDLREALGQRYIAAGAPSGVSFRVHGVPGNDMCSFMDGARVEVFGNAQDQLGNTMNDGEIVVHGSCGDAAGYGMRGGSIFVEGDCGWRVGIHMKRYRDKNPTIFVGGDAGAFLGEYMAGGTIVLLGRPGDYLATGMHGGVIYLQYRVEEHQVSWSLVQERVDADDVKALRRHLARYERLFGKGCDTPPEDFFKLVPKSKRPYGSVYSSS